MGLESASIEISPFRPHFIKFSDHSEVFFCFSIHKQLNKSCSLDKIFLFLKKSFVSLKKTAFEILWSEVWKGGFQLMLILDPKNVFKIFRNFKSTNSSLFSDWLWPYCVFIILGWSDAVFRNSTIEFTYLLRYPCGG